MKTCIVSVLPPVRGGVALYTLGLISGFEKANSCPPLIAIVNDSAKIEVETQKLKLVKIWTKGPKYFFQVLSGIIREKPTIVHFQHEFFLYGGMSSALIFPLLLLFTRLMDMKVVVTLHGVVPKSFANTQFAEAFFVTTNLFILRFGVGALTTIICKLANAVIVHSNFAKDVLYRDYAISSQKIRVIPLGVGTTNSGGDKSTNENVVLFFGNITPSKGIEILIAAFEQIRIPNTKLVIAGAPHPRGENYFHEINRIIQLSSASKSIVLTGYITDERIHSLFEECTLAVFPYNCAVSSSAALSFALQHQKPVVVTALPTFTEIITHGKNGIVVPPNDSKALAEAIGQILLDQQLRQKISQGILKSRCNLAWPIVAANTLEVYQTC